MCPLQFTSARVIIKLAAKLWAPWHLQNNSLHGFINMHKNGLRLGQDGRELGSCPGVAGDVTALNLRQGWCGIKTLIICGSSKPVSVFPRHSCGRYLLWTKLRGPDNKTLWQGGVLCVKGHVTRVNINAELWVNAFHQDWWCYLHWQFIRIFAQRKEILIYKKGLIISLQILFQSWMPLPHFDKIFD